MTQQDWQRVAKLFALVFVYIALIYILFSQMKTLIEPFRPQFKIIRHFGVRQHEKFVFWQPILATTNLLNYKLENLFLIPDPTVNMAISHFLKILIPFPSYTEDLFSYHNS